MKKILFVTNIPSPYSADLFYYLQSSIKKYKFYVLYTHETEDNRKWTIDKEYHYSKIKDFKGQDKTGHQIYSYSWKSF